MNKNKFACCLWLGLSFVFSLGLDVAFAASATEFTLNPKGKIESVLGFGTLNRIKVDGSEVLEVVGDESKYSLSFSSDYSNMFVLPKIPVGEVLEMSFVMVGGNAVDARFIVGDVTAQTIFINAPTNSLVNSEGSREEISQMLRAMKEGSNRNGKYYVVPCERKLPKIGVLKLLQVKTYRYKDLSGCVLIVENISKKRIDLKPSDFKDVFEGTSAIKIEEISPPSRFSRVFIVTKGGK